MKVSDIREIPAALREKVWELYEESFPEHERRTRSAQATAFADPSAHSEVWLGEEEELAGIAFYWLFDDTVYLEFLAIHPSMRGHRIGSGIIDALLTRYPGKRMILEIEPPVEELAARRLRFYERLGFVRNPYAYTHPSYRKGEHACPHELVIMTHGRIATPEAFARFTDFMRRVVWQYAD